MTSAAQTGIMVHTSHPFYLLPYYMLRPNLRVDGGPEVKYKWGEAFISVQPGQHTVQCAAKSVLGFGLRVAKSQTTVTVQPGQVISLRWKSPKLYLPFLKGKWIVEDTSAASTAAAA